MTFANIAPEDHANNLAMWLIAHQCLDLCPGYWHGCDLRTSTCWAILLMCLWGYPCLSIWASQHFVPPVASIPPLREITAPCPQCPSHFPLVTAAEVDWLSLPCSPSAHATCPVPLTLWLHLSSSRTYSLHRFPPCCDLSFLVIFQVCSLKT